MRISRQETRANQCALKVAVGKSPENELVPEKRGKKLHSSGNADECSSRNTIVACSVLLHHPMSRKSQRASKILTTAESFPGYRHLMRDFSERNNEAKRFNRTMVTMLESFEAQI